MQIQVGGSTITVQDEGSALSTGATTLNFVGAGVTATGSGATKTITVGSGVSTLGALTDTAISSANAGNILLHDGSDSFDNKVVKSNDITLAHTTALAIPMGGFTFGPISATVVQTIMFLQTIQVEVQIQTTLIFICFRTCLYI